MRRSYKDRKTYEEAMKIIKDVAGSQLDPDIVAILMTIPKEEIIIFAFVQTMSELTEYKEVTKCLI